MDLGTFALNVGSAALMGMAIGLERQFRQHTAGLRTNALVCVGAALFVSLPLLGPAPDGSAARIAAQVVSGIGFLGGGVILREGFNVRGMNTAATLWCSAAIGTLAGSGFLLAGAVGTAAVLSVHLTLRPLVRRIDSRWQTAVEVETVYRIRVVCQEDQAGVVRTILLRHVNSQPHMSLQGISSAETEQGQQTVVTAEVFAAERNDKFLNDVASRISIEPSVTAVSWDRAT